MVIENRVRFIKELIEDIREIVIGKAAVATRFSVGLKRLRYQLRCLRTIGRST